MSAEEFWKDDPQLFFAYRTSFINKKKREVEENDYKSWLQGLYIYDGNSRLLASLKQFIGNMVSKHRDNKKIDSYPSKPYIEKQKEEAKTNKEKQKQIERKEQFKNYHNSLIYFGTMKQRYFEKIQKECDKNGQ